MHDKILSDLILTVAFKRFLLLRETTVCSLGNYSVKTADIRQKAVDNTTQNNALVKTLLGTVTATGKFSESPNLFKIPVTCTAYRYRGLRCALCSVHFMYSLYKCSGFSNLQSLFSLFKPFQYIWHISWHFLFLYIPNLSQHLNTLKTYTLILIQNKIKILLAHAKPSKENKCWILIAFIQLRNCLTN